MNENKYIEVKEDLKSIIDAAFYDFDDYVTDCHEKDESPVIDVEDFVADAIIKAGYVKQGEWISVEDRLPERPGKYLVYTVKGATKLGDYCSYLVDDKPQFDWYVTHWMPLPEPPKMKGGTE